VSGRLAVQARGESRLVSNPFSTRATRVAAERLFDTEGRPLAVEEIAGLIEVAGGGALVGPHGSGKSTRLAALAAVFAAAGREVRSVRLDAGDRPAAAVLACLRATAGAVVCIDGFDRLGPLLGEIVRWLTVRRRLLLVVTAHYGRPLLLRIECRTSRRQLAEIVRRLPGAGGPLGALDIHEAYDSAAGDLREALFDLYDRFEARMLRNQSAAGSTACDGNEDSAGGRSGIHDSPR